MLQTISLETAAATKRLGTQLARQLQAPVCVLLEGDLGAGKTSLARAIIQNLTGDHYADVPSPTFTLLQTYESPLGPIYHYDLYRLKQADEVYELDWETALSEAITLVEWPERLGDLRPRRAKSIALSVIAEHRNANLEGFAHVAI